MKALVIADNENVIESVAKILQKFDFETIIYRWLLKALDNISEIAPHLIVISAEDYPRHWKTLAQYSRDDMGASKVILYRGAAFSKEEQKKADAIGVFGTFSSENNFKELEDLITMFQPSPNVSVDFTRTEVEPLVAEENAQEETKNEEPKEKVITSCSFVFTNPVSLALVCGCARNFDGDTLEFTPDIDDFVRNLPAETNINLATLKTATGIRSVSATVVSNDSEKLVLRIVA